MKKEFFIAFFALLMNNEFRNTGFHTVVIDGSKLSSGINFYQFTSEKINAVKKMILIK